MGYEDMVGLGRQALLLSLMVSLPVVFAAALISVVTAALQTATRVVDSTVSHLPRLLVVTLVLGLAGPWMGKEILAFAVRAFAVRS